MADEAKQTESGQWVRGDFHAHTTVSSDGHHHPNDFMKLARDGALDFVSMTDHNLVGGWGQVTESRTNLPLIMPGIEVTLYEGHYNVFPMHPDIEEKWSSWMQTLLDRYVKDGDNEEATNRAMQAALTAGQINSINHPCLPPWAWEFKKTDLKLVHCLEIINDPTWPGSNGHPSNKEASQAAIAMWTAWLNEGWRITAIGGSDYHGPLREPAGYQPSLTRPATYVYADSLAIHPIIDGLKAHRAYVTMIGPVAFTVTNNGQTMGIGADLGLFSGTLLFEGHVQDVPAGATAHLIHNGQSIATAPPVDGNATISNRIDVDGSQPNWFRLDVIAADGEYLVVTNPIFVGPAKEPHRTLYGDFT